MTAPTTINHPLYHKWSMEMQLRYDTMPLWWWNNEQHAAHFEVNKPRLLRELIAGQPLYRMPFRWTMRRKLTLLRILIQGTISREEAKKLLDISQSELARWQHLYEKQGVDGLRGKRTKHARRLDAQPRGLTPRQELTLLFIKDHWTRHIQSPSLMEISDAINAEYSTARHMTIQLADKDYIIRKPGQVRGLTLTSKGENYQEKQS